MQCALEKQVKESLLRLGVMSGCRVGVAVSGGVDSMVLLHCLCVLRTELDIEITAYHMEHGIRAESADDMRFVQAQCDKCHVQCAVERVDVPALAAQRRVSVETAARDARYAFLDKQDVDVMATAHQQDDMAETVLMNLLRGSGLAGLCGIPERRGKYIRPLLKVSRREIEAYARENDVEYVQDVTNSDTGYTRNYVRHELLPRMAQVNANATGNIARAAVMLAEDEEALTDYARRSGCIEDGSEGMQVDIKVLKTLMSAVQKRVIRQLAAAHCGLVDIESVHVDAMLRLALRGESGNRVDIGGGFFAAVVYGKLIVGRAVKKRYNEVFEALSGRFEFGGWCFEVSSYAGEPQYGADAEYFDADAVSGAVFRHRREGDMITPLGMTGAKRLSDYLSDRKVPLHRRDTLVVLVRDSEIFWVVGVGVSDKSRVKPDIDIIKISFGEIGYARGYTKDTVQ